MVVQHRLQSGYGQAGPFGFVASRAQGCLCSSNSVFSLVMLQQVPLVLSRAELRAVYARPTASLVWLCSSRSLWFCREQSSGLFMVVQQRLSFGYAPAGPFGFVASRAQGCSWSSSSVFRLVMLQQVPLVLSRAELRAVHGRPAASFVWLCSSRSLWFCREQGSGL